MAPATIERNFARGSLATSLARLILTPVRFTLCRCYILIKIKLFSQLSLNCSGWDSRTRFHFLSEGKLAFYFTLGENAHTFSSASVLSCAYPGIFLFSPTFWAGKYREHLIVIYPRRDKTKTKTTCCDHRLLTFMLVLIDCSRSLIACSRSPWRNLLPISPRRHSSSAGA